MMDASCIVGIVAAGLLGLDLIVRAGYSFRAEYKGMKIEVTPPEAARPRSGDQPTEGMVSRSHLR
jgi:hypothetical protein